MNKKGLGYYMGQLFVVVISCCIMAIAAALTFKFVTFLIF